MLKIKNKTGQPLSIPLRSRDHRSLETAGLGARAEMVVDEESTTHMIDVMEKRGLIRVTKVV